MQLRKFYRRREGKIEGARWVKNTIRKLIESPSLGTEELIETEQPNTEHA